MSSEYDSLPDERILARGRLFVVMKLALAALLTLIIIAIMIYVFTEPGGEVYVSSNIEGARIYIDSYPTEYLTNSTILEIPSGEHLFSVELEGYNIIGNYVQRIKVSPGRSDSIHFILEKIGENDGQ